MAGPKDEDPTDKLAELLASVYGPDEAGARDELVQSALKRLEVTHRQAALALRNFESTGTVETPGAAGGATPGRRRKGAPGASDSSASTQARASSASTVAVEAKPAAKPAAAPPAATPSAAATPPPRPKLPPARVQRVALIHSREPLEIHSGEGQSVHFDEPK